MYWTVIPQQEAQSFKSDIAYISIHFYNLRGSLSSH